MQYRRRIKIAPGVQLNMSKGGMSVTVGPRGLRYTFGRGKSDLNVGLPGTGFYFRKHIPPPGTGKTSEEKSAEKTARKARHNPAQEPKEEAVVQVLVPALPPNAPPTEAAYREGALHFLQGDYRSAFDIFSRLEDKGYLADELLMTGLAASYLEEYDTAMDSLIALLEAGPDPLPGDPNSLTVRYLPDTTVIVPLTQFAELELPLNMNMAALLLAELLDARGRYEEVIDLIEGLFEVNPDDPALLLSLVDLYSRGSEFDKLHDLLVKYQHHLHGDDDISLGLMLFWGAALAEKELFDAADDVFKTAERKAKHNDELTKLLMYARADLYERMGHAANSRKLFERLYGLEPTFYDVADRLEALKSAAP